MAKYVELEKAKKAGKAAYSSTPILRMWDEDIYFMKIH